MGWYQRRVHGEGAQFRNGNHPPSRQTRVGGFHPLSLGAEGSLPAARASAPSADRAHTTHYQQRPPRSGKFFPKNQFTQDLSPLTERASCHTNRQKSSTAMRVVSRAGDSEARPLQRY